MRIEFTNPPRDKFSDNFIEGEMIVTGDGQNWKLSFHLMWPIDLAHPLCLQELTPEGDVVKERRITFTPDQQKTLGDNPCFCMDWRQGDGKVLGVGNRIKAFYHYKP